MSKKKNVLNKLAKQLHKACDGGIKLTGDPGGDMTLSWQDDDGKWHAATGPDIEKLYKDALVAVKKSE